jgi:hypothetical protein
MWAHAWAWGFSLMMDLHHCNQSQLICNPDRSRTDPSPLSAYLPRGLMSRPAHRSREHREPAFVRINVRIELASSYRSRLKVARLRSN